MLQRLMLTTLSRCRNAYVIIATVNVMWYCVRAMLKTWVLFLPRPTKDLRLTPVCSSRHRDFSCECGSVVNASFRQSSSISIFTESLQYTTRCFCSSRDLLV